LPHFLAEEEVHHLLLICKEHHPDFYPLLYTALATGMRLGELKHLRWCDVDFSRRQIKVENQPAWHTKSYKPRTIPLTDKLAEVLNNLPQGNKTEPIFSFVNVRKLWEDTRKKAGLDCRFHDIRHTYASHLTMKGVPLNTVRELLGHSDLALLQIYAHLTPNHLAEEANKLPY
jgi:integrase